MLIKETVFMLRNSPHTTMKNGQKINTKKHYDYISRENEYSKIRQQTEDLVYKSSDNLPSWANNPGDFWLAAEKYRRENGRAYREITVALQMELSLEENIECIEALLKESGIKKNHVFSYAVHDKPAAIDADKRNIHAHIMFNEKIIEKDRPLSPEDYFKQYYLNAKGLPSAGYKSERGWTTKDKTLELRKLWAKIVNEKFKRKGSELRITEKSLQDQKAELILQNKIAEAKEPYFNRAPEAKLSRNQRNPNNLKKIRQHVKDVQNEVNTNVAQMTDTEYSIYLFSCNHVVRRLARELQLIREMERENKNIAAKDFDTAYTKAHEPLLISAEDIVNSLSLIIAKEFSRKTASEKRYKEKRQAILSEHKLREKAYDCLLDNKYIIAKNEYKKVLKEIEKINIALSKTSEKNTSTKIDLLDKLAHKKGERINIGKEIGTYNRMIKNFSPESVKSFEQILLANNHRYENNAKNIYQEIIISKHNIKKWQNLHNKLLSIVPNTILFTEKVPKQLHQFCKLNGETLLKMLPCKIYNQDVYWLTGKNSVAVKQGDEITNGTVPVYMIIKDNNGKIAAIEKTKKTMPLYKTHNRKYTITKDDKEKCIHKIERFAQKNGLGHFLNNLARALLDDNETMHQKKAKHEQEYIKKNDAERADEDLGNYIK